MTVHKCHLPGFAALSAAWLSVQPAFAAPPASAIVHDVVYIGARAIDPETGLDAVRNIAVDADRITTITADPVKGRRMIDARGLIAAPGFIDLHSHATNAEAAGYQAKDGVTTRLELEIGAYPVRRWYEVRQGRELLNYGTSVGHTPIRYFLQKGGGAAGLEALGRREAFFSGPEIDRPIPDAAYGQLAPLLQEGLREGAIGIGSGTQYAPGITYKEMLDVTRVAGKAHTCVFTHVRYGSLVEPDSTLESVQESIANAAATGACVHVVHINSMAMSDAPLMVDLMRGARDRGVDVSTEIYPWGGSVDSIRSVIFDPGWEKRWGVTVGDLQSRSTGKRLTQAEFDALRGGTADDGVIMHMNSEATITALLRDPMVMVASDGGDIAGPNSHPRSAGTFARILGHYVRETGVLAWSEAIRRMALMPAQRLEAFVPAMRRKGRLQAGADADIVLFDPDKVGARAAYGDAARYSEGFNYVMVNGVLVVDQGKLVPDVRPGRPIRSEIKP
ncbi:D-glutamate deacylase [Sphingomonas sp. DBB INV C78]|uniref:amidohydrolase family protein n=1 Tax=Sphingomonas sp. DBB INV C78 TaxID=3349434 RepID=UPI0036D22888